MVDSNEGVNFWALAQTLFEPLLAFDFDKGLIDFVERILPLHSLRSEGNINTYLLEIGFPD